MNSPPSTVRFGDCEVGWIDMWITANDGPEIKFEISYIYDPAPSMLAWLEAIAIGCHRCSFLLDEECCEVLFEFHRKWGKTWFYIQDESRGLSMEIAPRALVSAFYTAFVTFSASSDYHPEHWEGVTLRDRIERESGISFSVWAEAQLSADRRTLQKALWHFDPEMAKDDLCDALELATDEEMLELGCVRPTQIDSRPHYWPVDSSWDAWGPEDRRRQLEELSGEPVGHWRGYSWPRLRSRRLDWWLGLDEERATSPEWPWARSNLLPVSPPTTARSGAADGILEFSDFHIGLEFWTETGQWRCTDVGTRTICALKVDSVGADWLNGPPYAVVESVFDEYDFGALYATRKDVPV